MHLLLSILPMQAGIKEMQRLWDRVVLDSRVTWEGNEQHRVQHVDNILGHAALNELTR